MDPDAINGVGTLTYSEVTLPNWLSLSSDGLLQGTPTNDNVGNHDMVVRVKDEAGVLLKKVLLTVNNTNDPPILQPFSGIKEYDFIEGEAETVNTILKRGTSKLLLSQCCLNDNTVDCGRGVREVSPTGYIPGGLKAQLFDIDGNKIGVEGQLTDVGGAGAHSWPIIVVMLILMTLLR